MVLVDVLALLKLPFAVVSALQSVWFKLLFDTDFDTTLTQESKGVRSLFTLPAFDTPSTQTSKD